MVIPELPDAFYKQHSLQTGTRSEILYENLDAILVRTIDRPLDLTNNIVQAPWIFEERYPGSVVVYMNARMESLQKIP